MAGFFNLPSARSTKKKDQKVTKKSAQSVKSSITIKGGGTLIDKIQNIVTICNSKFKDKLEEFILIRTEQSLIDYIDACIETGYISIDTETMGLDPILDDIVGLCIYTPGQKPAYVPISHIDYITNTLLSNQLSREFIAEQLKRIKENNIKVIMFNAPFDIRVIGNSLGIWLTCYWDCYVASRLLNENEPQGFRGLKALHKKYCRNNEGEAYSFDKLFSGIPFNLIPIKTAYLYASNDAVITFELFKFQEPYFDVNNELCKEYELQDVSKLFFEVEMPVLQVFLTMEQTGVYVDLDYAKSISEKYHDISNKTAQRVLDVVSMYKDEIESYRRSTPNCKLSDPINLDSPTQLAILLYDILKITPPDKNSPRGTGVEILEKIDNPVCKAILDNRALNKAISTYIDKLPNIVNPKDGRIHCKFNQLGADTGRTSSNDPNLQNIPSKPIKLSTGEVIDAGHDIRQFFSASNGNVLLSCDYSAQEPRLTAHLSNDEKMIQAYREGKDVYCQIASVAYNVPYEDCKEFRPDGTHNPEGKARRTAAKSIVLGICYGRGIPSIAEQLGTTVQEAQRIYDTVLQKFEGLKKFMEESENMARTKGFVTTVWGRKRRLPDMQLPMFEFTYKDGINPDFDPLFDDPNDIQTEVPIELVKEYTDKLIRCKSFKQKQHLIETIEQQGINVKNNRGYIEQATRQVVNSRVQGSAADMTKIAMINLFNDEELNKLGFKMLIPVHDEIIAECPKENVKRCAELMQLRMKEAANGLKVPVECDLEVFNRWYGDSLDIETLLPIGGH